MHLALPTLNAACFVVVLSGAKHLGLFPWHGIAPNDQRFFASLRMTGSRYVENHRCWRWD
jgi:hypothetical protein